MKSSFRKVDVASYLRSCYIVRSWRRYVKAALIINIRQTNRINGSFTYNNVSRTLQAASTVDCRIACVVSRTFPSITIVQQKLLHHILIFIVQFRILRKLQAGKAHILNKLGVFFRPSIILFFFCCLTALRSSAQRAIARLTAWISSCTTTPLFFHQCFVLLTNWNVITND